VLTKTFNNNQKTQKSIAIKAELNKKEEREK